LNPAWVYSRVTTDKRGCYVRDYGRGEREAFLADVHVGVLGIGRADRAPLPVPVWYGYVPGQDLYFVTGPGRQRPTG
jgi:nitroimidazol reductase NimA-like FMN-containing flavoprotein (pyridoxamine 5'-phosphate oxidase superfamily)